MKVQDYVSEQSTKGKGKASAVSKAYAVSNKSKSRKDPVKENSNMTKSFAEPVPCTHHDNMSV